jgi:hypothetical protein
MMEAADVDVLFAFAGLGDVVGGLHAHEGVHLDAEGFFDAQGHVAREIGFAVQSGWRGLSGRPEGEI